MLTEVCDTVLVSFLKFLQQFLIFNTLINVTGYMLCGIGRRESGCMIIKMFRSCH